MLNLKFGILAAFLVFICIAIMASHGDFFLNPNWEEEEEDQALLGETTGRRYKHVGVRNPSRSRSRSHSPSIKSAVTVTDGGLDARIGKALLEKFTSASRAENPDHEGLSGKMESIQLAQRDLVRQQAAAKMRTVGGRFQFLALAEVKGKVEIVEKSVSSAIGNSYSISPPDLLKLAQTLQEARDLLGRRMELVSKADATPNGFKVLTAYQKKVAETSGDAQQDKLWQETAKQIEKEKEKTESKPKRSFPAFGPKRGIASILMFHLTDAALPLGPFKLAYSTTLCISLAT